MMKSQQLIPLVIAVVMFLTAPALGKVTAATQAAAINLNQASIEELATLPNIGPKRAARIVERRQQKPFTSVDELVEIKGIGPKALEKLRPLVVVSSQPVRKP